MKNFSKKASLLTLFLFSFFSVSTAFADTEVMAPKVNVFGVNIVSVWQTVDSDTGNTGIQGGTGSYSLPGSLTFTTLNLSGTTVNSTPSLVGDTAGDVVATWQYVDSNGNFQVAASVLPTSTTTWTTPTQLSTTSGETAGFFDQVASIDATSGNVLVTWTSSDGTTMRIRGATYNITGGTWTTGINISQN